MKMQFPNGDPVTLPIVQARAVARVAARFKLASPVVVHPLPLSNAVMVDAGPFWLGIEEDGHTHS